MENEIEEKKNKKVIIYTALFISGIILAVFFVTMLIMALCLPGSFGDISYGLGFRKTSLIFYEKEFLKNNKIESLYIWTSKSVQAEDDENIIRACETIFATNEYATHIINVSDKNVEKTSNKLQKVYVYNEDDYLKTSYVKALINSDNKQKAFDFAVKDLENDILKSNISDRYNFVLDSYIEELNNNIDYSPFFVLNDGESLFNKIDNYYYSLNVIYNIADQEQKSDKLKLQLAALASKIAEVGNVLLLLDEKASSGTIDRVEYKSNVAQKLAALVELTK